MSTIPFLRFISFAQVDADAGRLERDRLASRIGTGYDEDAEIPAALYLDRHRLVAQERVAGANEGKLRARRKAGHAPFVYARHLRERVEEVYRPEDIFRVDDPIFAVYQLRGKLAEDTRLFQHLLAVELAVFIVERHQRPRLHIDAAAGTGAVDHRAGKLRQRVLADEESIAPVAQSEHAFLKHTGDRRVVEQCVTAPAHRLFEAAHLLAQQGKFLRGVIIEMPVVVDHGEHPRLLRKIAHVAQQYPKVRIFLARVGEGLLHPAGEGQQKPYFDQLLAGEQPVLLRRLKHEGDGYYLVYPRQFALITAISFNIHIERLTPFKLSHIKGRSDIPRDKRPDLAAAAPRDQFRYLRNFETAISSFFYVHFVPAFYFSK